MRCIIADATTTEIYTLSLHDALPIWAVCSKSARSALLRDIREALLFDRCATPISIRTALRADCERSEEHTSELQSPDHIVCRILLEETKRARYLSLLASGMRPRY